VTERPDRRQALGRIAAWLAVGAPLAVEGCAGGPPIPKDALVVDLEKVPAGTVTRVRHRLSPVLLVRLGGEVRALSGNCTHEGCEVGWNPRQQLIRCPCHGSAFTAAGAVVQGPALKPLPAYPVELRGRKVIVTGIE
jgi:nitrite reductase/ring-hydroxylating ferredoxin subunit